MNAYDIYEFYIEAADLKGQAHKVRVQEAYVKEVFNPGTKGKDKKIILRLVGKQKVLSLNKTRTGKMIEITGTPDFEKWAGVEIIIKPGRQSNKDTVVIEKPASQPAKTEAVYAAGPKLQAILTKAETDPLAAFSDLTKAAGLDSGTVQSILRDCGGDYDEAFQQIARQYAPVIG